MSNSPDHVEAARTRQTVSIAGTGVMSGLAVPAVTGVWKRRVIAGGQPTFFPFSLC